MKKLSIFTFLNIIFSISVVLLFILLFIYIKVEKHKHQIAQNDRYALMLHNLSSTKTKDVVELFKNKLDLKKVSNKKLQLDIIKKAKNIYHNSTTNTTMNILNLDDKTYVYIKNYNTNIIFIDNPKMKYDISNILIVAIFILFLLGFLYFMLLQKLKPLKLLDDNISQFKKGDLIINNNINSQDEIGKISENFNQAIQNIKYLIESKNLFMRNIMHELKTPITKSLFLANMIDTKDKNDKDELIKNLYNMDEILKELTNIDKSQTQFTNVVLEKVDIKVLLKNIKNNINQNGIIITYKEDIELIVNHELFYTALKNLIDNGLKYSTNNEVIIDINNNKIIIKSKGDKLSKDLDYYTQAFTQEYKNSKGFGLGLYIVKQILQVHKFTLEYRYEDGYNNFCILVSNK